MLQPHFDAQSKLTSACVAIELQEEGLSLVQLFRKITEGKYPEINRVYSTTLCDLVAAMLDLDAAKRPSIDVCDATRLDCFHDMLFSTSAKLQKGCATISHV